MSNANVVLLLVLQNDDPTWYAAPVLFRVLVWGGVVAVAVSILVILGILVYEVWHNKVW